MARHRDDGLIGEMFDLLREVFRVVHPAWAILLAAVLVATPLAWFHFRVQQAALRPLA